MGKKKTVFVWVLLVFVAIWLFFSAIGVIISLISIDKLLTPALFSNPTNNIIDLILTIIGLVLTTIFFVKLYNVRPDVVKWVHITFGFVVISTLIKFILIFILFSLFSILSLPMLILVLIFEILMWIGITKHLKRAQREKLMDFS